MLAGMVLMRHEVIVELIRLCPAFAAEMLTDVADLVVLEAWLSRVATAEAISDVFD